MLIRPISDAHMEVYRHSTVPANIKWDEFMVPVRDRDSEAVLVLAGDICEFGYAMFYATMWKELSKRFLAVVYVPGNHEYFGATAPYGRETFFYFKELFRRYGNIYLLDNSSVVIAGQKFYGTTLWTDYASNASAAMLCTGMGDFRWSRTQDGKESRVTIPQDYIERYAFAEAALREELAKGDDLVVVSHFAPSHRSIHARYMDIKPFEANLHYANRLDELIMDNPQIKLWQHGHTHTQFDYVIGTTRIICNPNGFDSEDTDKHTDLTYVEV